MPRPHYPSQGGPHRAAWNPSEARKSRRGVSSRQSDSAEASGAQVSGAVGSGIHAISSRERGAEPLSPPPLTAGLEAQFAAGFHNNKTVLWCAALLCLLAAVFAIAAILGHG